MITSKITQYDEELVQKSRQFLDAAKKYPLSREVLEKYGYTKEESDRGEILVRDSLASFEWEQKGIAWNFLSPTAERRMKEARDWYADRRRRWVRECFRNAEEEAGWVGSRPASKWPLQRKLTAGMLLALEQAVKALSLAKWREHKDQLAEDLRMAAGERPAGSPPPKDTVLVELNGWYERWRLLAQRVFRERPDLMAPFGLTPGKAPPRLRGKAAAAFGEKAANSLPVIS